MTNENGVDAKLARLDEQMKDLKTDVAEVLARVDGPPWERSIRGRLHLLETQSATADAVHAALKEMKENRIQNREQSFSRRQKLLGAFIGVSALSLQLVTVLIVVHH